MLDYHQQPDYALSQPGVKQKNTPEGDAQGVFLDVPHRGLQPPTCYGSDEAVDRILTLLYQDSPRPETPLSSKSEEKVHRNAEIRHRYQHGETITELAREYGLSLQRISQIVHQTGE